MEKLSTEISQSWLSWFWRGILFLGFLVLAGRLFELQIIRGAYYRNLSGKNRIRRISIIAPRGRIMARGGEVLVGNREEKKTVIFDPNQGYIKTNEVGSTPLGETITEYKRNYPLGGVLGHVAGYLGQIGHDEVGKVNPACIQRGPKKLGSLTGKSGLESWYDCSLSGIDGEELIEVDSSGRSVRVLGKRDPLPGTDLHTSINFSLQKKVVEAMGGARGAVIATDTKGEVLAYYSSPSFNPEKPEQYLESEGLPFFDRVISGTFHPGSVFKPVVAVAALEEGKIDEEYKFNDKGVIEIKSPYGDFTYFNWYFTQYGRTEGEIGIKKAIARSTDTFFYKAGELVGPEKIAEWADKFGFTRPVGIDLPGEAGGLIPTPSWKEATRGERWFLGNTYHMAIGQGDTAVTPIEVNNMTAAIASGGEICSPKVADSAKRVCHTLALDKKNLDLVRMGMRDACSTGGTGYTFFNFQPQVACKTGTAEVDSGEETHAWFTLFAPYESPEIVLTVLVERGGEGSRVAGPIARKIMDGWKLGKYP